MLLVVGAHNCPNKVENRTFRDLEYSIAFLVMAVKSLCSFVIILSQCMYYVKKSQGSKKSLLGFVLSLVNGKNLKWFF